MATVNNQSVSGSTINGTSSGDTILGANISEVLSGLDGSDTIHGNDGNDTLYGGGDGDNLFGGNGNDILDAGGYYYNTLTGGAGADVFVVNTATLDSYNIEQEITDFTIYQDRLDISKTGISDIETVNRLLSVGYYTNELTLTVYTNGKYSETILNGLWGSGITELDASNVLLNTTLKDDVLTASDRSDLFGGLGNDQLTGSSSYYGDRLFGESGNDILNGLAGDDLLVGGSGNDTLNGGTDDDVLEGGSGNDTLNGGSGDDQLTGGAGSDVFVAQQAATYGDWTRITDFSVEEQDKLDFRTLGISDIATLKYLVTAEKDEGGDIIETHKNGYSAELALTGVSVAELTTANVLLNTSTANTNQYASGQSDLFGGLGNNRLVGSSSSDRLFGEGGDDTLEGGDNNDLLVGGSGNDSLLGGNGYDTLEGGIGSDKLYGNDGNDILRGGAGNDILDGGLGYDVISGGAGNDLFISSTGGDFLDGGEGIDTLSFAAQGLALNVNLGLTGTQRIEATNYTDLRILNIENVTGGYADDRLLGNASNNILDGGNGNDLLSGGLGNDTLRGAAGSDTLNGGSGVDTASYAGSAAVKVDLNLTTAQNTIGAGSDRLLYIENLTGSSAADTLIGNAAANVLDGGAGNDILTGNAGNDRLIGGLGRDTLNGGTGNDVYDFNAFNESGLTSTTWDIIQGFQKGFDKIDLSTLDAKAATTTVNDAFTFIGTAAFTAAGQVRMVGDVLYANTDASMTTNEFAIQIAGVTGLAATDFYL